MSDHLVSAQLDPETTRRFKAFRERMGMSKSAAIRVLIAEALRRDEESPEAIFSKTAFQEGMLKGVHALRKRLSETITATLGDLDGE